MCTMRSLVLMEIGKEFTFDSAHYLIDYRGPCEHIHGHTYRFEVTLSGAVGEGGMVMDFAEIKAVVEALVLSKLDHKLLNDIIPQPTAEHIAIWIWNALKKSLPLSSIKLWESPGSFVIYRGNEGVSEAHA